MNPFQPNKTGPLTDQLTLVRNAQLGKLVPEKHNPGKVVKSICGYCSTGCELTIHLRDGVAVNVSPSPRYPVNVGMACPKGWEALTPLTAPDRLKAPLLRNKQGQLEPVSWETALDVFTTRFKSIQKWHGRGALAYISTGQIVFEEMALLGAVAKFGMGMLHGDGNTRQCMATSVVSYKESFGFDAPPFTYADFEESDVILLVGSNLCIAHPILWQRVLQNKRRPAIVVVDPRRTETAQAATHHVALKPKSDLDFLYGLAHILIRDGKIQKKFIEESTNSFEEFSEHISSYTPLSVAEICGIPVASLEELAAMIGNPENRVSFWWTMGINQSHQGTRTAQAIINLALMTGNIGKPGTGANSITGQCNAMGSRLFSNTTNLIGGHDFSNATHREKISHLLKIPVEKIQDKPGLAYDQIMEGVQDGAIKGLWIIATNTAHSWMSTKRVKDIFQRLDFLVVQDLYGTTETAQLADLVLPAAGWGEKEGCFINSERRIGRVQKVTEPPGLAKTDFEIFQLVAKAWGCADLVADWSTPEAVFQLLKSVTVNQPCNITGISGYEMLENEGGIQWPLSSGTGKPEAERRLFEDGRFYHVDGKARFIFEAPKPMPEAPDVHFPTILLTGRGTSAQWHTQTRTSKSAILRMMYPKDIYVELNPADATALAIESEEMVRICSRRSSIEARAVISGSVAQGQVFIPMHYVETNYLTNWAVDPYSRQPAYKACAVRLEKIYA